MVVTHRTGGSRNEIRVRTRVSVCFEWLDAHSVLVEVLFGLSGEFSSLIADPTK